MRWPLRYQILVPFAGVMLGVVLGVSLLDAFFAARRTERQIAAQLHEVARTLGQANFPLTDAVLKQARGLSGAELLLADRDGKLWASSLANVDMSAIPRVASRERQSSSLGDLLQLSGESYFHSAIAVRGLPGAESGPMLLHILYSERYLREARWQAAYPPLVLGSILLGVVVVLAIAIAGRLTRPILDLRLQLSRLVQGDFRPVALPQRNDELRDLIGSVNLLSDQLDEMRGIIKRTERLALLGQLSGGLAHQLRNSVTGARIAVQLHQRHCHDIDQDSLAVALRQLTITESHLQGFLTAGQPSAPRRAECDLRRVATDVMALVAPACEHRGVALRSSLGEVDIELQADAEQLRQLLMNLVLNAIDAAGTGGWVRIEMALGVREAMIRVLDSGPGPPERVADRLFEPFVTGKPEGIGLGLAVSKKIAESHGGTLRYVDGGQTCFELRLPLDDLLARLPLPATALVTDKKIESLP